MGETQNTNIFQHYQYSKNDQFTKKGISVINTNINEKQMPWQFNDIFNAQLKKHIDPNKEVAVLSALPLFYLDYKGVSALTEFS